jgi:hypothetical protein
MNFKFTDEFQARLAAHRLWVPESQRHFMAIHGIVDFGPSRFDNLLRAPAASTRDRMGIRTSQLVGRATSARSLRTLGHGNKAKMAAGSLGRMKVPPALAKTTKSRLPASL